MHKLGRLLPWVLTLLGLAGLVSGAWLAWILPSVVNPEGQYENTPRCATVAMAFNQDCYRRLPMVVYDVRERKTSVGDIVPLATIVYDQHLTQTVVVVRPPSTYFSLRNGEHVTVKVVDGVAVAIYPLTGKGMRTYFDPLNLNSRIDPFGAELLLLGAVALLYGAPGSVLFARLATARPGWVTRDPLAGRIRREPWLLVSVVAIVATQCADMVTSIAIWSPTVFEANGYIEALWLQVGLVPGIILAKIPLLLVLILVVARLKGIGLAAVSVAAALPTGIVALSNVILGQGSSGA